MTDRFFLCVLSLLLLSSGQSYGADFGIKLSLNKQKDQLYYEGEKLQIRVEASQECYLQIIYHDASNKSYLVYPNNGSSPDGKVDANKIILLGQGIDVDGFEFEISPPFGGEMIRVYASTQPLPKPEGKIIDGGAIELQDNPDKLNVFYHTKSADRKCLLTDATILLKTAPKTAIRNPDTKSPQIESSTGNPASFSKPRIFGFVVGVSRYASPKINALKYADADAESFAEFCMSKDGLGIPENRMRVLINEKAARENILDGLENFLSQTNKNDMVVIYIASHGITSAQNNATYFLCYDADVRDLAATAVDQADVTKILSEKVQAGKLVFFVDACHGGSLGLTGVRFRGAPSPLSSRLLVDLVTKKDGTAFFSASRAMEQSFEGTQWGGGHGVFTYYLMEGLKKNADLNKDGIVTIDELAEYVSGRVREDTGAKQHPELKGYFDNNLSLSVVR